MLEVRDLDLYYGAAHTLKRVSLNAQPGQVTCVLGRNGVGKSSLMRGIVGHLRVSGSIRLDGTEVAGPPPTGARASASPSCHRVVRSFRC